VITIWMAYFVVAVVASCVFLVAGWRSKQAHGFTAARSGHGLPHDPLWDEAEIDLSESQDQADAGAALRLALERLAPVMASRSVQADVAAAFGLRVRMRGAVLADLIEEMLSAAIHAAPASRILLTAAARNEHIAICITDDIPNADPEVRRAGVRGVMERAAMRGGALTVDVRPEEGTTMTLRLSAVAEDSETRPLPDPPKTPRANRVPEISFGMSR
jgi:signal transduction histidine kinase